MTAAPSHQTTAQRSEHPDSFYLLMSVIWLGQGCAWLGGGVFLTLSWPHDAPIPWELEVPLIVLIGVLYLFGIPACAFFVREVWRNAQICWRASHAR